MGAAFDIGAATRALNKVTMAGQAAAAADDALGLGDQALADADGLPSPFFGDGGTYGATQTKARLAGELDVIRRFRTDYVGGGSIAITPTWRQGTNQLRNALTTYFIEMGAMYENLGTPSVWSTMFDDLEKDIEAYGEKIGKEGIVGGAGMIIGDAISIVGHGVHNAEEGAVTGIKDALKPATDLPADLLLGLLKKYWWVLALSGVLIVGALVVEEKAGL